MKDNKEFSGFFEMQALAKKHVLGLICSTHLNHTFFGIIKIKHSRTDIIQIFKNKINTQILKTVFHYKTRSHSQNETSPKR